MGACHSCDNPPCCNPTHLFEGSTLDNIRDAAAKGRMALGKRNVRARYKFRGMARKELTPALVQLIRLSLAEGYEGSRIAAFLGINAATVSRIKNGTRHVEVAA
jgi:hypothetical protein